MEDENTSPGTALAPAGATALVAPTSGQLEHARRLVEQADEAALDARAEKTRRMYKSEWGIFAEFCSRRGFQPFPASPQVVRLFLYSSAAGCPPDPHLDREGDPDPGLPAVKVTTVVVRRAAIAAAHTTRGLPSPCNDPLVMEQMKALRRRYGKPPAKSKPLSLAQLRRVLSAIEGDLLGLRDKAILTVLFCGALRRAELCSINVRDLEFVDEGLKLTIPRSKTDKDGRGAEVALLYHDDPLTCPVRAIKTWMKAAGISTTGRLFRGISKRTGLLLPKVHEQHVAEMLRARMVLAGFEREQVYRQEVVDDTDPQGKRVIAGYSGHSARRGFLTEAGKTQATIKELQKYSRHKTAQMVIEYQEAARSMQGDAVSAMFTKPKE